MTNMTVFVRSQNMSLGAAMRPALGATAELKPVLVVKNTGVARVPASHPSQDAAAVCPIVMVAE